ncbi:hypothetical protein [Shimazuella kribbensis]|nr:hypothetical protein [Shimazuella kribbensis]
MNTLLFVVDVQNGFVSSKTEFVLERITNIAWTTPDNFPNSWTN